LQKGKLQVPSVLCTLFRFLPYVFPFLVSHFHCYMLSMAYLFLSQILEAPKKEEVSLLEIFRFVQKMCQLCRYVFQQSKNFSS
jgi:hypothetical protein